MDPALLVAVSTSGDYRRSTDVSHTTETIPFAVDLDDARSEIGGEIFDTEAPSGVSSARRPVFSGRLFSLKNNKTRSRLGGATNWGGRMFDYKGKYEEDEWGAEMADESRFCKMYNDESEIFDLERIESWRDALDVLLVFIGLFSAIVTTFVVQTSQALQPDYGQLTASLVYNLILVQRAVIVNGTIASLSFPEDPSTPSVHPSLIDKWVTGLWFASLAISLSTALITVLTKQWLYRYMVQTSGTSKERARLRQFRFAGLEKYRVPMIIDLLPVALYLSLALFFVGLALFLFPLHRDISAVVAIVSGLAYTSYAVSAIIPLFDPQCPYQSPISGYLSHMKGSVLYWFHQAEWRMISCVLWSIKRRNSPETRAWAHRTEDDSSHSQKSFFVRLSKYYSALTKRLAPSTSSLQAQERQVVWHQRYQLDIDAITWLHSTSSNSTVRDISYQAVVGLTPSDSNTSQLGDALRNHPFSGFGDLKRREYIYLPKGFTSPPSMDLYEVLKLETSLHQEGENRWTAVKHRNVTMSDFITPGSHCDVKLPLSTWAICISYIARGHLDPILITRLLPVFNSFDPEFGHDKSRMTFVNALWHNDYLRSLVVDILAEKLNITRTKTLSLGSLALLIEIWYWAFPHLDDSHYGRSADLSPPWPQDVTGSLLTVCIQQYKREYDPSSCSENEKQHLWDTCASLLKHKAASKSTEVSWRAYQAATGALYSLCQFDKSLVVCHPDLIEALITHLHRTTPPGTSDADIKESLRAVQHIVGAGWVDPAMIYDLLLEVDVLPLSLAKSGDDRSYHARFWGYEMCRRAVFVGDDNKNVLGADTSADWILSWFQYISAPDRLLFLFRRMVHTISWGLLAPRLFSRVVPLLELTTTCPQWATCFQSLIDLLNDDEYIRSIMNCDNPRHQLSIILLWMQKSGRFSADLSAFIVPLFDEDDNPISPLCDSMGGDMSSATNIVEDTHLLEAVPEPPNDDQPSDIAEDSHLSEAVSELSNDNQPSIISAPAPSTALTRVWDKTKAVVRFAPQRMLSLKRLEEAEVKESAGVEMGHMQENESGRSQ